jgi:exonuclease SbcD
MRILHSADIHLGELPGPVVNGQNARLLDTLRCFDFMVEYAEKERPDVILIAGDLFDKSKLWGDNMLSLIDAAARRLRKLADIAPTVLMFGTDNHDSLKAFENILNMNIPGLRVVTEPGIFLAGTPSGYLQVACLPGFDKGYFRAKHPGMEPAEESVMCSKFLGDMVNGLSAQLDPTVPSVLMGHYTVVGCELDNGQHVFSQNEVVLLKEALAGSAFDLVALGHIHRAQQVECAGKPVFYSGPPNGITFNEEGQDKGFWMHEIGTTEGEEFAEIQSYVGSEFIKTPYREFITLEADFRDSVDLQADLKWQLAGISERTGEALLQFPTVGKIVRLHYDCTEEQRSLLNHKEMENLLRTGGAFHVAEIKPRQVITSLIKQELTETSGPLENLHAWLTAEGFEPNDITPIIELARPLIATVSAKMPTGTLNGVFEPRSLTVKNYRSYRSESLNFQDIYFAIVNGENGIGKSSLFMDAISDCLYEESRTKVIGEWISNGQTDGSIWFEFSMGTTIWRVVRARSIKGSGKIVLSLDENVNGEWVNRSGTTAKQTQEKIETLLGMDCATFQCTALIMQDAYGKFMEASKEDRMSVLANILGLGAYEQLTDLAKAKVSELNKSLAISKAKLTELDEKLKDKPGLEVELKQRESDLKCIVEDIAAKESEAKEAEELVRTLKTKAEKAEDLRQQIKIIKDEVFAKQLEIGQKRQNSERAQKMLENEAAIFKKAEEYATVRDQITLLEAKQPILDGFNTQSNAIVKDITELDSQYYRLEPQVLELDKTLASKPELDEAAEQYRLELARLEVLDDLASRASAVNQLILEAEKDTDRTGDEIYDKRLVLKDIQTKLEELAKKSSMLTNSNCIDPDNAKCAFLADAQKAKAEIPKVEQQIKAIEQEIADMMEARKPFEKIVVDLNTQYDAIGYNLVKDCQVHYDLRNFVNQLRPKAELAGQLESKAELLVGLRTQMQDIENSRIDLRGKLRELHESSMALKKEFKELPALRDRLPKLKQWADAKEELPAARQIVSSTKDIIKGIEADIKDKEQMIVDLQYETEMLSAEIIGLTGAEINVKELTNALKSLQNQQLDITSKIGALTAQLETLSKNEAERKQVADDMAPLAKSLTNHQTLVKAFGLDGIPFSIVRSVVPELSMMANDILGQMTGGQMSLKIETERVQKNKKEVNAIEVWIIDYRGNISYGNRSGGQKVKAALANAFALADLKARRAGIQLGMMHVDEPPFLDSAGVEAYCDALEGLNHRYPNMRVIAISHDPAMKARFPQQIDVVDMGDEGSKVRIA